jgi:adenosylmethionine-8-amino-7-oxononanoate aminotransferase
VSDVRVLGAIGVVELESAIDTSKLMPLFIELGVWVRPFGNIVYLMPPFIITKDELSTLTSAVLKVVATLAT